MYYTQQGSAEKSENGLQLVSVVAGRPEADAVLRVWDSVKAESLIRRAEMSVLLCGIGEERALKNMPAAVAVNRVKHPEEFSTRTGIRVVPFSLVIAGGDNVLAAGAGLPDASFIRDAAERFIREGPSAATRFRPVTLEINSGLTSIERLFPSSAAAIDPIDNGKHPSIVETFRRSITRVQELACDVILAPHPKLVALARNSRG